VSNHLGIFFENKSIIQADLHKALFSLYSRPLYPYPDPHLSKVAKWLIDPLLLRKAEPEPFVSVLNLQGTEFKPCNHLHSYVK
jgi:hypothetical protein